MAALELTLAHQLTLLIEACPLRLPVPNVHYPSTIEDMTAWLKTQLLFRILEMYKCRVEQDHVAAFVHNIAATPLAGHLARKVVPYAFLAWIIPSEVVVAIDEIDILFMENCRPLEGGRMQSLTSCTMTVLRVQRLFSIYLKLDSAAVTTAFMYRAKYS